MPSMIQRLRALVPSREQLEVNPWLSALAPYLADPKLWHRSRRGVAAGAAIGLFIGLAITAGFAAVASYLLISHAWIWHIASKRRAARQ